MTLMIESPQHERVVACTKLQQRKFRKQLRQCLVEGPHAVEEALKAGLSPEALFLDERFEGTFPWLIGLSPECLILAGERVMKKLSTTETPSPCVGVFPLPCPQTDQTLESTSCVLVLDGLQDPGNLGSLIRSAVAFEASAVVLTQNSVDPYSPKVIRASAGLVFHCPIVSVNEPLDVFLSGVSGTVLLTSSHTLDTAQPPMPYDALPPIEGPLYLILGNEGNGLSGELPEQDDASLKQLWITIPMNPRVESLNVAMCGSILLAHFHSRSGHTDLRR